MEAPHLKAFKDHIRPFVVEIDVRWQAPGEEPKRQTGTGTIIALSGEPGSEERTRCAVATAKHVLPPTIIHDALKYCPPQKRPRVEYKITRSAIEHPRTVTLTYGPNKPTPDLHRLMSDDPSYDGAILNFPMIDDDGNPFVDRDESSPNLYDPGHLFLVGTRIAWAGYPGIAEQLLAEKQLCYYEGQISATINRPNPLYLVDGHVSHGVSGGPVWSASVAHRTEPDTVFAEDLDDLSYGIIGVVSAYQGDIPVPGLCIFTPLNPLVAFIKTMTDKRLPSAEVEGLPATDGEIESKQQPSSTPTATGSVEGEPAPAGAEPASEN